MVDKLNTTVFFTMLLFSIVFVIQHNREFEIRDIFLNCFLKSTSLVPIQPHTTFCSNYIVEIALSIVILPGTGSSGSGKCIIAYSNM